MNIKENQKTPDEAIVTREPGQRSWASALSRIPEPFRLAMADFARNFSKIEAASLEPKDISELELGMLPGGKALSLITFAAHLPYHLIDEEDIEMSCGRLRKDGPKALLLWLKEIIDKSQSILIIGDDPSEEIISLAMKKCKESSQDGMIKEIIIGPGNLMEPCVRAWAQNTLWPEGYLRSLDSSGGDVWHAKAGDAIDTAVRQLFEFHKPTKVVLLEPVRLPATQSTIEYASKMKIPMLTIPAQRILASPK